MVVLVASPSARSSRYVKDELRIAEMYRRPVYRLWALGNAWMDAVPIGWGGTQYIDAREERYQEAIHELVEILEKLNTPADAAVAGPEPSSLQREPPRNPYKGLHAFRREDAGDFFGRSRFINALVEALQKQLATEEQGASRARLLTVIGSSGSGKSSVVMAGLLPQLQRGVLPGRRHLPERRVRGGALPGQVVGARLLDPLHDGVPSRRPAARCATRHRSDP